MIIVKIRENKSNGQKMAYIPKKADWLKTGDYIKITKVQE